MAFKMQTEFLRSKTKGAHINQKGENIMEVIRRSPGSQLEEVVLECPDLIWKQGFVS